MDELQSLSDKRGNQKMKSPNITIKNTTTNILLVGTQLEWNLWLNTGYILESPEMILQELKKQQPESEFELLDVQAVMNVRALFNLFIKK